MRRTNFRLLDKRNKNSRDGYVQRVTIVKPFSFSHPPTAPGLTTLSSQCAGGVLTGHTAIPSLISTRATIAAFKKREFHVRRMTWKLYQIVPRPSVSSILSVLSIIRISNLHVFNVTYGFDFHTPPPSFRIIPDDVARQALFLRSEPVSVKQTGSRSVRDL